MSEQDFQSFMSEADRADWITRGADYFTTIRFRDRRYERSVHPTRTDAELAGRRMVAEDPSRPIIIYAVRGEQSVWVQNIYPENK